MKALKSVLAASSLALGMLIPPVAFAQEAAQIRVYGPGGPAPAIKEAAKAFEKKTGTTVLVTAGPTPEWIARAKADADVIYSGSETMMTDFAQAMEGRFDETKAEPLYLRPLAILVRPGNPKNITGLADLFKPGRRVLVVNGAGQNGAWEDAAGRKGEIASVRALRANIAKYAKNSALARQDWINDPSLDAWIIWNIWQVANPTLADVVPIESEYAIYRDTGIVATGKGETNPAAMEFIAFVKSANGAAIFQRWGWLAGSGPVRQNK